MRYARIYTNDSRFKKMLSLELEDIGMSIITEKIHPDIKPSLLYTVIDLDCFSDQEISVLSKDTVVIGFSRAQADEISDKVSRCTRFLHRPFLISDFLEMFILDDGNAVPTPFRIPPSHVSKTSAQRKINRLYINDVDKTAIYGNHKISLSANEYKILRLLCERGGEIVFKNEINNALGISEGNMGDVYVCHLRRKLDNSLGIKFIYTVRGKGYILKN